MGYEWKVWEWRTVNDLHSHQFVQIYEGGSVFMVVWTTLRSKLGSSSCVKIECFG